MTSEAQAALGENVTKLIDEWPNRSSESIASAAIDIVLEEAAKVAEEKVAYSSGQEVMRESIAAAIRAMKGMQIPHRPEDCAADQCRPHSNPHDRADDPERDRKE